MPTTSTTGASSSAAGFAASAGRQGKHSDSAPATRKHASSCFMGRFYSKMATPQGVFPTGMSLILAFFAVSITDTLSERPLAT